MALKSWVCRVTQSDAPFIRSGMVSRRPVAGPPFRPVIRVCTGWPWPCVQPAAPAAARTTPKKDHDKKQPRGDGGGKLTPQAPLLPTRRLRPQREEKTKTTAG